MKTFSQFMIEANYDPEIQGRSQIRKSGEGGRLYPSKKKTKPEIRRMKAVGGGKMEPVGYKDRKDIGQQKPKSQTQQQPQQERGSKEVKQTYADKIKAERRAAAKARAAAKKSGGEVQKPKTSSRETEKQATKLLSTKKPEKKVSPNYKPQKASGYTRQERMKITRAGERELSKEFKRQELGKVEKETGKKATGKLKTIALARAHQRMST